MCFMVGSPLRRKNSTHADESMSFINVPRFQFLVGQRVIGFASQCLFDEPTLLMHPQKIRQSLSYSRRLLLFSGSFLNLLQIRSINFNCNSHIVYENKMKFSAGKMYLKSDGIQRFVQMKLGQ